MRARLSSLPGAIAAGAGTITLVVLDRGLSLGEPFAALRGFAWVGLLAVLGLDVALRLRGPWPLGSRGAAALLLHAGLVLGVAGVAREAGPARESAVAAVLDLSAQDPGGPVREERTAHVPPRLLVREDLAARPARAATTTALAFLVATACAFAVGRAGSRGTGAAAAGIVLVLGAVSTVLARRAWLHDFPGGRARLALVSSAPGHTLRPRVVPAPEGLGLPALSLRLRQDGRDAPLWIFSGDVEQPSGAPAPVAFHRVASPEERARLLARPEAVAGSGTVVVRGTATGTVVRLDLPASLGRTVEVDGRRVTVVKALRNAVKAARSQGPERPDEPPLAPVAVVEVVAPAAPGTVALPKKLVLEPVEQEPGAPGPGAPPVTATYVFPHALLPEHALALIEGPEPGRVELVVRAPGVPDVSVVLPKGEPTPVPGTPRVLLTWDEALPSARSVPELVPLDAPDAAGGPALQVRIDDRKGGSASGWLAPSARDPSFLRFEAVFEGAAYSVAAAPGEAPDDDRGLLLLGLAAGLGVAAVLTFAIGASRRIERVPSGRGGT